MSYPSRSFTIEWLLFDARQYAFKCDLATAIPDDLGHYRSAGYYGLSVFVSANKACDRCSVSSLNGDERPGIEKESHQAERFVCRAAGTSASNSSRVQPCSARISSNAAPSAAWRSLWRIAIASHAETFVLSAWAAARKACPSWGSNETLNFSTLTL